MALTLRLKSRKYDLLQSSFYQILCRHFRNLRNLRRHQNVKTYFKVEIRRICIRILISNQIVMIHQSLCSQLSYFFNLSLQIHVLYTTDKEENAVTDPRFPRGDAPAYYFAKFLPNKAWKCKKLDGLGFLWLPPPWILHWNITLYGNNVVVFRKILLFNDFMIHLL